MMQATFFVVFTECGCLTAVLEPTIDIGEDL
jgi:hypothetical protein